MKLQSAVPVVNPAAQSSEIFRNIRHIVAERQNKAEVLRMLKELVEWTSITASSQILRRNAHTCEAEGGPKMTFWSLPSSDR